MKFSGKDPAFAHPRVIYSFGQYARGGVHARARLAGLLAAQPEHHLHHHYPARAGRAWPVLQGARTAWSCSGWTTSTCSSRWACACSACASVNLHSSDPEMPLGGSLRHSPVSRRWPTPCANARCANAPVAGCCRWSRCRLQQAIADGRFGRLGRLPHGAG